MEKLKSLFFNLLLPGCILSGLAGAIVGVVVFFYKVLVEILLELSVKGYDYIREYKYFIPIVLVIVSGICFGQAYIIKRVPYAKGGGIPTSEGIVRGSIEANPFLSLFFTAVLSFISFLIGLPFGNEGPSVSIGTSISAITSKIFPKNEKCYKRYIMTGGASAAFAVATGSPITGIIFALEEIHRKFSPMILLVSFSSVIAGSTMAYVLSKQLGFSYYLFGDIYYATLPAKLYPTLIGLGIIIGIIAVLFNKLINHFQFVLDVKLKNVPVWVKLLISYVLTILIGLFIPEFLGGGHSLIEKMMYDDIKLYTLIILLILKVLCIAWISQSGITGGMFIPILTIGGIIGAIFANIFVLSEYKTLFIAMSMVAFMAASIGCTLSALVFAVEALHAYDNILPFAIVVFFAYIVTKICNVNHVYDLLLERKLHEDYGKKNFVVIETNIEVVENSFAVGKQAKDLLFPANVLILHIKRKDKDYAKMDNFGEKVIKPGDIITFRVQTYDIHKTMEGFEAFLGKQNTFTYETVQS